MSTTTRADLTTPIVWGAAGLGAGALLAYLLDPDQGRRRRALVRDQLVHGSHATQDLVRRGAVDVQNRLVGSAAEARSHLRRQHVDDPVLEERVRSVLGRHVSHPGSLEVGVREGVVTLQGPILRREARGALRAVTHTPGVHDVEDHLERHETADRVPGLQGGGWVAHRSPLTRENWAPATRIAGTVAGASLATQGLRLGGPIGAVTTGTGALLLARSTTNMPLKRIFGIGAGRRAIDIQKDIHIECSAEELFNVFRHLRAFPSFMSHIRSVERVGENRYRWEAYGPFGTKARWDAEITRFENNRLLSWKSIPGSPIEQAGTIRLDPDDGGTRLEVHMSYNPPAGALGHLVARMLRADPKRALDEDLLRLKSLMEEGKARARGRAVTLEDVEREPVDVPAENVPAE